MPPGHIPRTPGLDELLPGGCLRWGCFRFSPGDVGARQWEICGRMELQGNEVEL